MGHQLPTTQGSGNTEERGSESSKMTIRAFPWRTGTQPLSVVSDIIWWAAASDTYSSCDALLCDRTRAMGTSLVWIKTTETLSQNDVPTQRQNIVLCQVICWSDRKLMTKGTPSGFLRCYEFCFLFLSRCGILKRDLIEHLVCLGYIGNLKREKFQYLNLICPFTYLY